MHKKTSTVRCSFFRVRKRSGCSPIGGRRGDAPRRAIPHFAIKNPAFRRDFLTHSKMRFPFRNILKKYLRQENQRRFIFGLFLLRFFNILLRLFKSAYMYAVQGAVFFFRQLSYPLRLLQCGLYFSNMHQPYADNQIYGMHRKHRRIWLQTQC